MPGTTKLSRYPGHQRSRATYPTPGAMRQRQGKRHHCFALDRRAGSFSQLARCCCTLPMHLVTARYRIVLTPSSQQRGHVSLQVAALDCSATAPLSPSSTAWVCQSVHEALLRPIHGLQRYLVSASQHGSMSAMALSVGLGSLTHRAGIPVRPSVLDPQLRQSYITPHCIKCWSSRSQAPLCPITASRPMGLRSRRYAKLPSLVRACQPSALPSLFASYVQLPVALVVCWHLGFSRLLRKWFWSVACGHASCVCPAHPGPRHAARGIGLARSARPPPRGSLRPAHSGQHHAIAYCACGCAVVGAKPMASPMRLRKTVILFG